MRTGPSRSDDFGEIIIFKPGVSEIKKSLEAINKILPSDVIAIPYYSQLEQHKKTYIEQLYSVEVAKLNIEKNQDFSSEFKDERDFKTNCLNGNGKYKRIIIIATNILEASTTIKSAKYVIDTGTQKVNKYDYKKRGEKLILENISETSRIQRRGRVGRISSGTVYYLYEKN